MPAFSRISFESGRPMPNRYVKAISTRLLRGRSTPAIRAMFPTPDRSALPLPVARVLAQHADHALAADDDAILADLLDRCSDFHGLLLGDARPRAHAASSNRAMTRSSTSVV